MTADLPRYAIYFIPRPDTPLYRFGSGFIGYDSYAGADEPDPIRLGFSAGDWTKLVSEPRRYGFHATLKAPFFLDPAYGEADLRETLFSLAASGHAPVAFQPIVRSLKSFVAIVPDTQPVTLDALAAACVTSFDKFRAPMTPQERERRLRANLTDVQISLLDRWGYPYVFDEFQFHMTLTGPVAAIHQVETEARLRQAFETACNEPTQVDQIVLLRENDRQSSFQVIAIAAVNPGS